MLAYLKKMASHSQVIASDYIANWGDQSQALLRRESLRRLSVGLELTADPSVLTEIVESGVKIRQPFNIVGG